MEHPKNLSATGSAIEALGLHGKSSYKRGDFIVAGNVYWDACDRLAELETQQARLLAVAVAAKGAVYHMQMCGDESDAQRNLLEALAAVEDLL